MNSPKDVLNAYDKLSFCKQEIDLKAAQIIEGDELFGSVSIKFIFDEISEISECRFQRFTSWLYTLYWEAGKKSDIKFLIDLFSSYELDESGNLSNHYHIVRSLRTSFQHNIFDEDSHNVKVQRNCLEWFESACGFSQPKSDSDWHNCLTKLFDDSHNFLKAILECIKTIENDESKDEIIRQWNLRRKRYFSSWDYDNLIREVMGDLGIEKDVVRLRSKYQSEWNKFLKNLSVSSDFRIELKKLILDTLLEKQEMLMPLLPDDIESKFDIVSGSQDMYKLLTKARNIYKSEPGLTKVELLTRLKMEL